MNKYFHFLNLKRDSFNVQPNPNTLHNSKQFSIAASATSTSRPFVVGFGISGIATATACIFSNPLEVAKTRLQLQGELGSNIRPFKNVFSAFASIAHKEGIAGFYQGFAPAVMYQVIMNGIRLGTYPTFKSLYGLDIQSDKHSWNYFLKSIGAGLTSGALGAFFGSPAFLIKVRLQTQISKKAASQGAVAVGAQHNFKGLSHGLREVYKTEGGLFGLFRGAESQIFRVCVGSATQLSVYDQARSYFDNISPNNTSPSLIHIMAASVSGICVAFAMNPPDVIASRIYNQPILPSGIGKYYSGPIDCLSKTVQKEGITALWKGVGAHSFRIVPHTIFTFLFLESYSSFAKSYGY